MTFSPTSRQVVLQELFDEFSEPTEEEIKDYARKLGIDVENEGYLLPLARDGLMQPLPSDWKPCYDSDCPGHIYYFNFKTGRAQWDHPLEEIHKALILKVKAETSSTEQFDEDSRTTVKEDLKSFEEALPSDSQRSDMNLKPRFLEPLAPLPVRGALRKPPNTLGPLKMASPALSNDYKKVSFDECEVKKRPNSSEIRNRRNIGPMEFRHLSKQEIMSPSSQWRDEGYATESSVAPSSQLTLSGGGAMFLKKTISKLGPDASPKKSMADHDLIEEVSDKELEENEEDEKKSVRFKLEKELKINFEMPTNSEIDDASRRSALSDPKQIEIDFEDLHIDLNDLKVPIEKEKTAVLKKAPTPWTKEMNQDKSNRSFKKSINIVLNGKSPLGISFEDKKGDNLIDFTEGDSTADSRNSELADKTKSSSGVPDSDEVLVVNKIEDAGVLDPATTKIEEKFISSMDDILKVSGSDGSSQTINDKPKIDELQHLEYEINLERTKQNLDAAKAEKLKTLEGEFNTWVKNTEKMFRDKEKQSYNKLKEKYEDWKKNEENVMIKEMGERCAEELQGKMKALRNELLKEEQEAVEVLRAAMAAQTLDRLRVLREEVEAREEQDLAALRKSLEDSLTNRKDELYRKHQEEMTRLERSLETLLTEQRIQRQQEIEKAREDEAALAAMRAQLKDAFLEQKTILQQEHEMTLQKLRQQHELELFQASNPKPDLSPRLSIPPVVLSNGKDGSDLRVYEKLRCEKRLLEDKYKSLKEKYVRLKSDVKLSFEKKPKKKEPLIQSASETDKSTSYKTGKSGEVDSPNVRRRADLAEKRLKMKKQLNHLDNVNQNVTTEDNDMVNSKNGRGELSPGRGLVTSRGGAEASSGDEAEDEKHVATSRRRRQLFSKLKAASTSRLNSTHRQQDKEDAVSPVENLRRQLKKLEELEDQFPVTTHTDTYLRYPFTDAPAPHFASSELEFFKHRIHLERDSVRRAKEFLKTQKKCYENRQRELQHRLMDGGPSSKSILEQIHQEERELTEMEVSVHRTRALLGEKIIRLRHLEHSLRRAAPERRANNSAPRSASREDGTLSDLSSHSDSSGFSSTHHTSEPVGPRPTLDKNRRHLQTSMQESSEIIQSLENLNSEIRGIWEVLKQSAGPGAVQLPPPPLAWPAVRTNPTAALTSKPLTQQIMTQVSSVGHVTPVIDSSLVDRTKSLRDWLKSARRSPNPGDVAASHQVTL